MAEEMVYGMGRRRPTYRSLDSLSPRFFCQAENNDEPHHFLDRCFLCKRHLGGNRDIFMYRGNTPFCSEECREEQIEIDEANERSWGSYASKQKQRKGKAAAASEIRVRATGTVVAG